MDHICVAYQISGGKALGRPCPICRNNCEDVAAFLTNAEYPDSTELFIVTGEEGSAETVKMYVTWSPSLHALSAKEPCLFVRGKAIALYRDMIFLGRPTEIGFLEEEEFLLRVRIVVAQREARIAKLKKELDEVAS